jgi:nucleotide-binding universal stress UspA family protein
MILCATDLSPSAHAATSLATWLGRRFHEPILLLHVVEPLPAAFPEVMVASTEWIRTMTEASRRQLEQVAEPLRKDGVTVEVRVLVGEPAVTILHEARVEKARFITVGTHGRKGAARLFLGSVAERIALGAPCPVIVTRDEAAPASHWPATRPLNLAVALDGSPAGLAALGWAGELRRIAACELTAVRVYSPPREATRYGLDDPWAGRQGHPEVARLVEREVRRELSALGGEGECRARLVPALGDPADELAVELTLLQPDAVVIGGGQQRGAWPHLRASAVLRSAPVPVIVVPQTAVQAPAMREVQSVLVPVDLHEPAPEALLMACGLLRPHGGRIELCTVREHGPAGEGVDLRPALPLDDRERHELEERLRALVPPQAEAAGIVTRPLVIEGLGATEAIVQTAERLGVDLIAVSSHGRSGIKRALLGSVAEEVARQSRIPVLIVHAGNDSQVRP